MKNRNPLLAILFLTMSLIEGNSLQAQSEIATIRTVNLPQQFAPSPLAPALLTPIHRHLFKIVYANGKDTIVTAKLNIDSSTHFLIISDENGTVTEKIFPQQTQYIARIDKSGSFRFRGMPTNGCWLFQTIAGRINVFTVVPENYVMNELVWFVQKENGPIVRLNNLNLSHMIKENPKAVAYLERNQFASAINAYNKELLPE